MTTRFVNRAHAKDALPDDAAIAAELEDAGIPIMQGLSSETFRKIGKTEVRTCYMGELHGWVFSRNWNYWVAEGPGLPFDVASSLHDCGFSIRARGHCADPHPFEMFGGLGAGSYHIDTPVGLKALANAIKFTVHQSQILYQQADKCKDCNGTKLVWCSRGDGPWNCPTCGK